MNIEELLSIITGKDELSCCGIIQDLGGLNYMGGLDLPAFERHPELTKFQGKRLWAAIQLGRATVVDTLQTSCITSPQDAYEEVKRFLLLENDECLVAIFVNNRKKVICTQVLTKGSQAYTIVDPRQIYHYAVQYRATGVILAHNHPSGDASPSQQDLDITERIAQAGKLLHIPLLDHLIVTNTSFTSLASLGVI